MTSGSLYNYVLEHFHNPDPIIREKNKNRNKNKNKNTVLFADIITHINQLVDVESENPASARINQRNFRRLIGMLTDNQRIILIIKLLVYMYIAPFLRYSTVMFLVLFRLYHAQHPEFINNRLNNSTVMAGFWSNYRLSIPTNEIYPSKSQLYNYDYSSINPKPLSITALKRNRNISNGIVSIRNELNQVQKELYNWTNTKYIDNKNIKKKKLSAISNKRKLNNSSKISPNVSVKSSLYNQIKISHPIVTATTPTINKILTQKKNLGNARVYSNKKQIRNKKVIKKNGKEYITGYILPEKGIAVIIENGKTYIYKLPKYLIDEYVENIA
jgi:hypothetical protein